MLAWVGSHDVTMPRLCSKLNGSVPSLRKSYHEILGDDAEEISIQIDWPEGFCRSTSAGAQLKRRPSR